MTPARIDRGRPIWAGPVSETAAWGAVIILLLLYAVSFVDRYVLSLMVDPVKSDLGVTDLQMGLLQGTAFGVLYATAGIPLGSLVDRTSPRRIIFGGVITWSLATLACGLNRNYLAFFLARIGVGAGEAALSPSAYAMIAGLFPLRRLGLALSIFTFGAVVGAGLALIGGASLIGVAERIAQRHYPILAGMHAWQIAFIILGGPGILFSLLVFLIPRPVRKTRADMVHHEGALQFIGREWRFFLTNFLGFGLNVCLAYGMNAWLPTLLKRRFALDTASAGLTIGTIQLTTGAIGIFAAGLIVDRMFANGVRDAHFRYPALAFLIAGVTGACLFNSASLNLVLVTIIVTMLCNPVAGVAAAQVQIVTPPALRGRVSAIYLAVTNVMGLVIGPALVGFITDRVAGGPSHLGLSLALFFGVLGPIASITCVLGMPAVRRILANQARDDAASGIVPGPLSDAVV